MHTSADIEEYRKLFWDAFHRPKFKTTKYSGMWEELERINDVLAGPFFSMYENGHIQYVFDDNERFPKVNSVEDFKIWATYLINVYHDEVESMDKPEGEDEKYDLHVLRFQTETKTKLMALIIKVVSGQ
ncbi:hypothetical protein [Cytophaga aurantiaca]|uniref:hypothetical protein n=1 Tax=Cytophaga aurantiaca TaxID=29530 RepID=UPI0003652163|nr:hypothetical protein [Cytophaga aurantiaca]